jgi:phosphoglycerate dehydrogenase-like enzyme
MKILYSSRSAEPDKGLQESLGARLVDLDTLLRNSDIVTLHVPLTPETKHLIGKTELAKMKPSAILVNTSRGPVVDEAALYQALRAKRLAAAGLDVFAEEPIRPDNPLLELENVVLLPHIGSASIRTRFTMARMCAENLQAGLSGARPANVVNPEVL